MVKVENIKAYNFEGAIRGMRNPMNSWAKSDSKFEGGNAIIGDNDLDLMKRLYEAGNEHRKYLRQIFVSFDITAPLYLFKEFDTFKVGTTSNSCSTMHKIHSKEFTLDDFSHEHLFGNQYERDVDEAIGILNLTIDMLNRYREEYIRTKDKDIWWQLIQLLPSSYNQRRTITMSYENIVNILKQRSNHKLDEWRDFCEIMRSELPYIKEIMGEE